MPHAEIRIRREPYYRLDAVTQGMTRLGFEIVPRAVPAPGKDPWTLPPERGRKAPHNIGAVLRGRGWKLAEQIAGTFGEIIGYWERA